MFKKLSIRKKLILGILLGCLIPYVVGGFYIRATTQEWLYKNNLENSSRNLVQTAKHVDETILENMKNLVSMISIDENIFKVTDDINSYVDYSPETFIKKYSQQEASITSYFETIKETQPNVTMVAYGTEDGGYIEVPTFEPTTTYDPRIRPWYINSIIDDNVVVSEPYITSVTNDLVFAVTKSVVKDGKRLGVVSLTIKLESLIAEINSMKDERSGYINILSSKNIFINSPYKEDWILKSTDEVDVDAFKNLETHDGNYFEGKIDGVEKVFNVYVSPVSGWKYISVIDRSIVLEQSGILTFVIFAIYLITFSIIFIIVLIISNHITKPILEIAHVINQMATFKFDKFKNKSFEKYTYQKDEIGEITRALDTMQDNFGELESNMIKMDEQIKTVDIDGPKAYQLLLSENNPFQNISSSVNDLLVKVHNSLGEVRKANDEITYKNDLLVNKEEVLTVKLEEIESQKEYIKYLAEHDPLTNLPNRRKFREVLKDSLQRSGKGTVVLLDLDNFKGINDTLGHIFGDKVLKHISQKIQELFIGDVFVSRFGGDEFLLLFEGETSQEDTVNYIISLQDHFSDIFSIDQHNIKIEFSVGVSVFPDDSTDINDLIMYADLALYTIKNSGKNNYAFFNQEMADHLKFKESTKEILRTAIINDGFKVLYQPIVDINTGEILSYEALLRLKEHKISPDVFIKIAEEEGLIITIGRIVTQKVVEQLASWKDSGLNLKPISINFSAVQIHDHLYKDFLFETLRKNNIDPNLIVIELTENIFLENTEYTIELMEDLRKKGVKIAIDDFGTGYSSLFYLTYLPIDYVKLDRELCLKFLELENISVMDSLISLIHSLNLKVIAEGIEDYEYVRRLIVGKCDAVQGYYFSVPIEGYEVLIRGDKYYTI